VLGYVTIGPAMALCTDGSMKKVYRTTMFDREISVISAKILSPGVSIICDNRSDITYFPMPHEGWSEYVKDDLTAWNLANNYFNVICATPEFKKNVAYLCGADCVVNMYPM